MATKKTTTKKSAAKKNNPSHVWIVVCKDGSLVFCGPFMTKKSASMHKYKGERIVKYGVIS